jgi:hypothetical protein
VAMNVDIGSQRRACERCGCDLLCWHGRGQVCGNCLAWEIVLEDIAARRVSPSTTWMIEYAMGMSRRRRPPLDERDRMIRAASRIRAVAEAA